MDGIEVFIAILLLSFITVHGKGNPSQVLGNPSQVLGNPSQVLGNPSQVLGNPSQVLGNPSNGREEVQIFELFDLQRIIDATDNFSDRNIIGEGQLGPVYQGVLEKGEEIAVKRAPRNAPNGYEQLQNELNLLARLKHKNLVRLMGYCIEGEEIILCFEFMPNSSLDQLLYGTRMSQVQLNWEQRFRLIQGISSEDRTFFTVSNIAGTRGYIAPELLQSGMLSTKTDVYSFGMVVLEIISGKRNSDDTSCPAGLVNLVSSSLSLTFSL
ncbi:G-type lectin S-receptor-like serine/threonine-protein kinase SD1-1 [Carex littledalei]|uniref:G-type lectin S-receptor-like serine/threonine-protein kinase SD1-1 n=1 Tax=Carex littledalei TaxID=544730 RepID=A0A833UZB1_9POAL|nr:G-type lectin S-receptor-like serine/threonine-protein kinase SD1-1 [Carex littledalei]